MPVQAIGRKEHYRISGRTAHREDQVLFQEDLENYYALAETETSAVNIFSENSSIKKKKKVEVYSEF